MLFKPQMGSQARQLHKRASPSPISHRHIDLEVDDFASQWQRFTFCNRYNTIRVSPRLSSDVVAAGATDFSGLQIIDLELGHVRQTINWENMTKSGSTVQAIGASPELLFTSFESSRRNSNSILVYDLNDSFKVVSELGHNEIFGADLSLIFFHCTLDLSFINGDFNYSTSFGSQTCNRIQLQHNSITTVFNYSRIQLHSSALQPTKQGLNVISLKRSQTIYQLTNTNPISTNT
ncbi:hypothetical protein LXL04_010346 [Taraxacum kok-saghyz]